VGVVAVLALVVTFAGMFMTYPALWRSFSYEWRRVPPERKPRAIGVGAGLLAFIVVVVVLVIVAPWGHANPASVMLIGVGGLMVVVLGVAGRQAFHDTRRAKRRRQAVSESLHEE
jgi:peptidoglycan/LPS O-acetylase OafA/YrhL